MNGSACMSIAPLTELLPNTLDNVLVIFPTFDTVTIDKSDIGNTVSIYRVTLVLTMQGVLTEPTETAICKTQILAETKTKRTKLTRTELKSFQGSS